MQETAKQPVGRGDHSSKRANAVESVFFSWVVSPHRRSGRRLRRSGMEAGWLAGMTSVDLNHHLETVWGIGVGVGDAAKCLCDCQSDHFPRQKGPYRLLPA